MTTTSSVDRIYRDVRALAATFGLKPGERVNEVALSKELGASRTPLREALNRLVSEGFLTFERGRGFFCRSLEAGEIFDLYEAREAVECEAVIRACERARAEQIRELQAFVERTRPRYSDDSSAEVLVALDEEFHMTIAHMSGNGELRRVLENLNHRIRYVRTIDMEERRHVNHDAHAGILEAIAARDAVGGVAKMRAHIEKRREEVTEAVRKAYANIYVP